MAKEPLLGLVGNNKGILTESGQPGDSVDRTATFAYPPLLDLLILGADAEDTAAERRQTEDVSILVMLHVLKASVTLICKLGEVHRELQLVLLHVPPHQIVVTRRVLALGIKGGSCIKHNEQNVVFLVDLDTTGVKIRVARQALDDNGIDYALLVGIVNCN